MCLPREQGLGVGTDGVWCSELSHVDFIVSDEEIQEDFK